MLWFPVRFDGSIEVANHFAAGRQVERLIAEVNVSKAWSRSHDVTRPFLGATANRRAFRVENAESVL